jgi:hypothetical protein
LFNTIGNSHKNDRLIRSKNARDSFFENIPKELVQQQMFFCEFVFFSNGFSNFFGVIISNLGEFLVSFFFVKGGRNETSETITLFNWGK